MLNKEQVKKIVYEIVINNNLTYFIDNYDFEIRKNIIDEFQKYPEIEDEILKDENNLMIFLSNLYTNSEAKELLYNSTNNEYKMFYGLNLSEEDKEIVINTPPYDEDYKDTIIESLKDQRKKEEYKKRYNVIEYIKDKTDKELKDYITNIKHMYNIAEVIKNFENDRDKYDYIIEYNLDTYDSNNVIKTIKDEEIIYEILLDERIEKEPYSSDYFKKLSDEYKYKVLENYVNNNKDMSLYIKEISSLSNEYKNKIFKLDNFNFNDIKGYSYNSIINNLNSDKELADTFVELYIRGKIPKDLILQFDSNYLLSQLIIRTRETFEKMEINNILNRIDDDKVIIELIDYLKGYRNNRYNYIFDFENILQYIKNGEERIKCLLDIKTNEFKDGKKFSLITLFNKEQENLLNAVNNPRINFDLEPFEIVDIAEYLSDKYKLEVIKNNQIITKEKKYAIAELLTDETKLKVIQNNIYDFNATDLIKLLSSITKSNDTDLIKLKEFKRLIEQAKLEENYNENTIKKMITSFNNKEIIVQLLDSDIIENIHAKGDIILYNLPKTKEMDKLKIKFIKYINNNANLLDSKTATLVISLFSSLSNDDIKVEELNNIIKDDINIQIKISVLEKIKDPKYDKIKVDLIKNNLKYNHFTYLIDSINNIFLIEELFNDNNIDIRRKSDLLCKLSNARYENIKIKIIEELFILNIQSHYITALVNSLNTDENRLKYFIKANVFDELNNFIIHNDYILSVKEVNENLVDIYSNKYNLNKKHLTVLIQKYGYEMLRSVTNDKIIELINTDDIIFNKVIKLFDVQETILVNDSHIDSVLHALLQKDYKLNNREIFNTFNNLVELITKEEYGKVIEKLEAIINYFKLNNIDYELEIFNKFNTTYVDFINNISDKSNLTNTLNILNAITNKYILENRNEYSNNHFNEFKNSLNLERTYEKNGLLKQFINSLNLDTIFSYIKPHAITDEEKELVNNKELLENIINLKKGNEISIDKSIIFSNIKIFNGLLDKLYMSGRLNHMGNDTIKSTYNIKKDNSSIIRILQELDIELLNKELLNNNELYDSLLNYLKSYRMIGWGNTFNDLSERVDMDLDENTIASFLNNYYLIYPKLQKKLEKDNKTLDEKRKITLTSFLEEAEVYASDSYKYKKILGTETFRLIRTNPGPNDARKLKKDERLEQSLEKVKDMYNREYITIPPSDTNIEVSDNKTLNYSVGYTTDIMNITYGERTGACMRIGGHADDLFDFCLKNENGFHIKITDPNNNELVSRASGFRNGNTVFLNQLRYSLSESYTDEEIIEGLKIFSNNIIEQTKDSEYPIKNVVISNMYAMDIKRAETIDMNCHNYKEGFDKFHMDLTSTNAILLAVENEDLYPIKLGPNNSVKYKVLREKIKEEQELETIIDAVDRLHMINDLLRENNIDNSIAYSEQVNLDNVDKIYYGEDWYILLDENNEIIDEFRIERNIGYIEQLEEMNSIKEKLNKERGVRL